MSLPESVEWFIEDQAFLRLYESAPHPTPFLCAAGRAYWLERGDRGWARRQITRRREILALHKSFNTLWSLPSSFFFVHVMQKCISFRLSSHSSIIRGIKQPQRWVKINENNRKKNSLNPNVNPTGESVPGGKPGWGGGCTRWPLLTQPRRASTVGSHQDLKELSHETGRWVEAVLGDLSSLNLVALLQLALTKTLTIHSTLYCMCIVKPLKG